jgi:phage/plasmid primase-like uncharacterized protein
MMNDLPEGQTQYDQEDAKSLLNGRPVLLPCPFCGAHADFEYEGDDGMGRAGCTNWQCGIGIFDTRDAAIEKWNKRI